MSTRLLIILTKEWGSWKNLDVMLIKVLEVNQKKLWDVKAEKFYLNSQYMKVIEISYSIMKVLFKNALKHVEFFP